MPESFNLKWLKNEKTITKQNYFFNTQKIKTQKHKDWSTFMAIGQNLMEMN